MRILPPRRDTRSSHRAPCAPRPRRGAWLGATLLLTVAPPLTAQTPSLGPLIAEDGAPLHRVTLTPNTESADPVTRGTVRWGLWLAYSNIFEQDSTGSHVLLVDMERLLSTTQLRVGITDALEMGARVTLETTGGGKLDGFVSWWHSTLGAPNGNRENFPNGAYDHRLETGDGTVVLDVPKRRLALEDVRLFAKARVLGSEGGSGSLSARVTTRIPTVRDPWVLERTDVGLSLLGRVSAQRWHVHGMLGAATARAIAASDELLFRPRTYHAMLGLERSVGDRTAAVVQYKINTPVFRAFDHREVDGPSYNLVFGFLGRMGDRWRWGVSFQEDLPPDTPSPDFTLAFRLSRDW